MKINPRAFSEEIDISEVFYPTKQHSNPKFIQKEKNGEKTLISANLKMSFQSETLFSCVYISGYCFKPFDIHHKKIITFLKENKPDIVSFYLKSPRRNRSHYQKHQHNSVETTKENILILARCLQKELQEMDFIKNICFFYKKPDLYSQTPEAKRHTDQKPIPDLVISFSRHGKKLLSPEDPIKVSSHTFNINSDNQHTL